MQIAPLDRGSLAEATAVLAAACAFDRAAEVAEEKLFGDGPDGAPRAFAAWRSGEPGDQGNSAGAGNGRRDEAVVGVAAVAEHGRRDEALVGVAAVAGDRIRVLAVAPEARRCGVGSALLAACEAAARAEGQRRLRTLDQPGNYLAPGIDERNAEAIGWLERRGWGRIGEPRCNVLIEVQDNPRVSRARAAELGAAAAARGYQVRRARPDENAVVEAVAAEFGGAWPFEVARALDGDPPGVHVATRDGAYCAFAAHDGNNRGLGWFGPTGTWPAHRGQGLGEALLLACLVDVAERHARCEIAWIGPRPFYDKVAGIAAERRFIVLARSLE